MKYIMDLSAPQFGIFGEKISVSEQLPEVFIFTAEVGDDIARGTAAMALPETYTGRPAPKITALYRPAGVAVPFNYHPLVLAHWIWTHNNA